MPHEHSVDRRRLLAAGAALAFGAGTLPGRVVAQTEAPKPARFVVNASGGAMGQAMQNSYVKLFEQRFGIPVVLTSPPDLGSSRPWSIPTMLNGM